MTTLLQDTYRRGERDVGTPWAGVTRAHRWAELLEGGRPGSASEIAAAQGMEGAEGATRPQSKAWMLNSPVRDRTPNGDSQSDAKAETHTHRLNAPV